ncbi:MAG: MMPL family transporter [Shewanella sp.]|nr:MMPL family transporter [Shewanella sp.]
MANFLTQFAINRPKTIYAAMLTMVIACAALFPMIIIDTDPENMLPATDQDRLFHKQVKDSFVMHDMIVVGAVSHSVTGIYNPKSLTALHSLSSQINNLEHVIATEQLALNTVDNITQAQHGGIRFQWLMQKAPSTLKQSIMIKKAVERLPLLASTLVSDDGKAAVIYVPVSSKKYSFQLAEQIRQIISQLNSNDDYHITGLPIAEDQFGTEMFIQMGVAAPLAGLAIFALLWWFFGSFKLIIAPMIVAMATVIITMGLLIGMGFTVHIMSSMIAIFLMPIAVVDSTHILSEFADTYNEGDDVNSVIKKVNSHLFTPMLYTSLTSAVGFLSLMLTPIPPVKVFGGFIAFGILLAFILTILFIPAYISRMSTDSLNELKRRMASNKQSNDNTLLHRMGLFAIKHRRFVLLTFASVTALSVIGINKVQVNDNPINWFKASHEIRVADKVLNEHFAGTYDAWLVLNSKPQNELKAINEFSSVLNESDISAPSIIKLFNQLSENPDNNWRQQMINLLDDLRFERSKDDVVPLSALIEQLEAQQSNQKVFLSPEVLTWMSSLSSALVDSGLVGKVNALPDIVKTVNRELKGGQQTDFELPASERAIAQTLMQYQSSHRPNDLWHFVTPEYNSSLMWLQMTSGDNQHMSQVIDFVDDYTKQHPLPKDISVNWAGKAYLNVVWQDAMVNGMLDSLLSSFLMVFFMMLILFRSFKYGILAMLPLTFTITIIYGLIGWFGKDYDMPIAVLSSLTLGLSVDFAIHYLQRFRELSKLSNSTRDALLKMYQEPARAITRNSIVVAIGFTPLLLSPLAPYITVGIFLASIMVISALTTLVLLPSIISYQKINFTPVVQARSHS